MVEQKASIQTEFITLDAFLKWAGVADTGGHAKALIASGDVLVNGDVEVRRGRKLYPGDRVVLRNVGKWLLTHEDG